MHNIPGPNHTAKWRRSPELSRKMTFKTAAQYLLVSFSSQRGNYLGFTNSCFDMTFADSK